MVILIGRFWEALVALFWDHTGLYDVFWLPGHGESFLKPVSKGCSRRFSGAVFTEQFSGRFSRAVFWGGQEKR